MLPYVAKYNKQWKNFDPLDFSVNYKAHSDLYNDIRNELDTIKN